MALGNAGDHACAHAHGSCRRPFSKELERAVAEARTRRLIRDGDLEAALARARGRQGVASLRAVLDSEHGPALTRSEAEERLLALLRAARLPQPETSTRVGRHEVDFLWRERRLVVEVDGYAFHSSRAAFERDRQFLKPEVRQRIRRLHRSLLAAS